MKGTNHENRIHHHCHNNRHNIHAAFGPIPIQVLQRERKFGGRQFHQLSNHVSCLHGNHLYRHNRCHSRRIVFNLGYRIPDPASAPTLLTQLLAIQAEASILRRWKDNLKLSLPISKQESLYPI